MTERDFSEEKHGSAPRKDTRTNVSDSYLPLGTLLAERYRLEQLLGVGGMGIVYRAHDTELDLDIALKLLRVDRSMPLERFRRELLLARQISHPNVVRIHDIDRHEDLHFITMDLVEGRSLRQILTEEGRLDSDRATSLLRQLAQALEAAHRQTIVHRDLKPENILVDESGQVYVSDFGVARSLRVNTLTEAGSVVGTPSYLSPEQAAGSTVDHRSDLYSLGLVVFEALTGDLPHPPGSASELLAQKMSGRLDLKPLSGRTSPRLERAIRHLLQRSPERRPQSATELLAELEGRGRPSRRPVPYVWLAAALLLAAAVAWWSTRDEPILRTHPEPAPTAETGGAPQAARHVVAVLPLTDETGRSDLSWASRGVAEALAEVLAGSSELQVVDSLRVFGTLEDLRLDRQVALSPTDLRRIAALFDANRVVVGRVRSLGSEVRLSLRVLDPRRPRETIGEIERAADDLDGLQRAVGELADGLASSLLERRPDVETSPRISPPEALAAYDRGIERLVAGDTLRAVGALEEAVEIDPGATAAWVRLADAYRSLGMLERAQQAADQAVDTAPFRSGRLYREARARQALLAGDVEAALAVLQDLVRRYPNAVEARLDLATSLGDFGRLDEAIAELERVTSRDQNHPTAWYHLAKYAIQSGHSKEAVEEYLVHALVIQNKLGNDQGRADVLNAFGVGFEDLGQLDQALSYYQQAGEIREQIGDQRGLATTLRNRAGIHMMQGGYDSAEELLQTAASILDEIGDRLGTADLVNDLGWLEERRGRIPKALEHYRRALRLRRELGDQRGEAESLNNVGFAYYLLGEYDNAALYWQEALELFSTTGNREGVIWCRQSIGQLEIARGHWTEATRSFHDALEAGRDLEMPDAIAVSSGYLGRLAHLQGDFLAAFELYQEALDSLIQIGDPQGLSEFTLFRAESHLRLGASEAARQDLDRVAEWLEESPNPEQQARLRLLSAELGRRTETPSTEAALRAARRAAEASGRYELGVAVADMAGQLALDAGDYALAERELSAAAESARVLGNVPLELQVLESTAALRLARERPEQATEAARRALAMVPGDTTYEGSYRLHLALAKALAAQGDSQAAQREAETASRKVAALRLSTEQRRSLEMLPEIAAIEEILDVDTP